MDVRDHKEGWTPKNWCFWTVVLEKILESPLDCKEIQPVFSKLKLWSHEVAIFFYVAFLVEKLFRDMAFIIYVILKLNFICIIPISNIFTLLFEIRV